MYRAYWEAFICETVFLDAGGVLVWPNWRRVAEVLHGHGIQADPAKLAAADPIARRFLDRADVLAESDDQRRGWRYFELILTHAGIPLSGAAAQALSVLREYHDAHNLWEFVPPFVRPALQELRQSGMRLVVVSNANGTVARAFERLGLSTLVDMIVDSGEVGVEKPDPRLFDAAL